MNSDRRRFVLGIAGALAAVAGGRVPAVRAQTAGTLIVYGDTVQGTKNIPADQAKDKGCVLNNRFPRNAEIVWRMRVIDPKTGKPMDDTMMDKVEVTLSNGQKVALHYGGHPPKQNRDFYWANAWLIPKDAPTGSLTYTVDATAKDGRTGQYKPFDIPSSQITITDQVLQDIAAGG